MQPRSLTLLAALAALTPALASCGAGEISPKTGTWTYNGSNVTTNTCGDNIVTDASGDFTITDNGDGTFTVDDNDGDPFTCNYSDGSFNCPERLFDTIDDTGVDATITLKASLSGDLDSSTALAGTQTVNVTCAGSSCGTVSAFLGIDALPCNYSYTFTATAK